jgi:hypothetical protein
VAATDGQPRVESVAALLAITGRIFDDERTRSATLTAKASTLAGFSGTILALVSVLGRDAFKLDLGSVGDPSLRGLFIVSVLALVSAAAFAISGVLRTQQHLWISTDEVISFAAPRWTCADPVDVEGNMVASLGLALKEERRVNDRKARRTDLAALALLVGLLAVGAQALIFAVCAGSGN